MLIDLLSAGNFVTYNTHIAKLLGLHLAIYLSELLRINDKANNKGKTQDNYFILDRDYIKERTTFDVDEQIALEERLENLEILHKPEDNRDAMYLDVERLTSMLMSDDEKLQEKVKVVANKKTKMTKQEKIVYNLQQIVECPNDELRAAYCDWVESVVSKSGWLSRATIQLAQEQVDMFSQRDLDVALDVVKIAASNGYRDMSWAIQKYKESGKRMPRKEEKRAVFGDDVF